MTTPIRILKDRGIRPRRHLGQSFLQDINIARKIVDFADLKQEETVVEIGAGVGIMTALIAEKACRVIALDVDPDMIAILKERLRQYDNVEVLQQDVLKYDFFKALPSGTSDKLKIIGNVPYNISSPILFCLMDFRKCISSMVLMLQREVVDRITASPGTKSYGIPSVILSMFCSMQRLLDVSAKCFYPEPRVVSSVVKIAVRERPLVELHNEDVFRKIVQLSFAKRRKTLFNNFRHAHLPGHSTESLLSALQKAGIEATRRAEALGVEDFGRIAGLLSAEEKA
jgi:16S rRNA (adenine1518-N6/adenine1519-N6)-dimethyltransferase